MEERASEIGHRGGGRGYSRQKKPHGQGRGGRKAWDVWNPRVMQLDSSVEEYGGMYVGR